MRLFTLFCSVLFICSTSIYGQTESISVDFGNASFTSPAPWNNLTNPRSGLIDSLINNYGIHTNISIQVTDAFNGVNTSGTENPDSSLQVDKNASKDSFFGNELLFNNSTEPTGGITLSYLDTSKTYQLNVFSSRIANDNRETQYILSGEKIDTLFLNVADNIDNQVQFNAKPAKNGTLTLQASPGSNNNNTYKFFYLGAIRLEYPVDSVPSPSLEIIQPEGNEYWQVGKEVNISWKSTSSHVSILNYSTDNGQTWMTIDTVAAHQKSYKWEIPNTPSKNCLFQITSDTLSKSTLNAFEISDDTTSCPIVVIGSSTAAGAGASQPKYSWVNRYRSATYQKDTRSEIINLAQGGYNTFKLLPTGTNPVNPHNITVDTNRNITKALSFNPSAIIVNLPSNDAARNISANTQMDNFRTIAEDAQQQGVKIWICTTQPRSFDSTRMQIQFETRDSILSYFGDYAIDFWSDIVSASGDIRPDLNSGDGVHLNDEGHRILFEKVVAKNIRDSLSCYNTITSTYSTLDISEIELKVYPNPFTERISFSFKTETKIQSYRLEIIDLTGKIIEVQQFNQIAQSNFSNEIENSSDWKRGLYFARFTLFSSQGLETIVKPIIKL